MGRLFGTDGARGIANSELTCELAMQIGRAAAMVLIGEHKKRPRVMIGMDTRISSNMLCSAITAGLCSVGADVMQLGVLPTPAVAFLVKKYKYDAAVMITASHNPCEYNGIKIFQADGYKLPDELEEKAPALADGEAGREVQPGELRGADGRHRQVAQAGAARRCQAGAADSAQAARRGALRAGDGQGDRHRRRAALPPAARRG